MIKIGKIGNYYKITKSELLQIENQPEIGELRIAAYERFRKWERGKVGKREAREVRRSK